MTYKQYFTKYAGKKIDFDGAFGVQCFDLANSFIYEVLGIRTAFTGMSAYQIYTDFEKQPNKICFDRIPNTPDFVPQQGDIIVWNIGKNGHVAIATGIGNTSCFTSYDQNWTGNNEGVELIEHNYNGVLGVLRPKNDISGYIKGDKTIGAYALKKLLMLDGAKLDDNYTIGNGSINAINARLVCWNLTPNGIAGKKFIKRMYGELAKKVK